MKKPLILVTNDDGISAPGIRALIAMMKEIGEVYVVAPNKPQSGMGHAVTINSTLRLEKFSFDGSKHNEWSCSGTPADCVKLAIHELLPRKPNLCVSGINHGSNSSISVMYSGTMAAAIEAGIEGVSAVGFSLCDFSYDADFVAAKPYILSIVRNVLANQLKQGVVLNVNIPKLKREQIKGIKICRQANGVWIEDFDKRVDPHGKSYYWLTGKFQNLDSGKDTDEFALEHGFLSIVPIQFDLTAHHVISELNQWDL